jgi:hypothetical protein
MPSKRKTKPSHLYGPLWLTDAIVSGDADHRIVVVIGSTAKTSRVLLSVITIGENRCLITTGGCTGWEEGRP